MNRHSKSRKKNEIPIVLVVFVHKILFDLYEKLSYFKQ